MLFNHRLRVVGPLAIAAVVLGMSACAQGESMPTPKVTVTAPAAESTSTESTEPAEPMTDSSEPVVSEEPLQEDTDIGPNDESGVVDVTVAGDQGILALQHAGAVPFGDAGPMDQKLITGPGGCFALTNQGKPQLVIFPADATFVLQEGKPSATVGGTEYFVGGQFSVATTAVPITSVAGIPDPCAQGSDGTVLIVR